MRFTSAGSHVLANPSAWGKLVLPYSMYPCSASPGKITGIPSRVFSNWYRCTALRRMAAFRGVNFIGADHSPAIVCRAVSVVYVPVGSITSTF